MPRSLHAKLAAVLAALGLGGADAAQQTPEQIAKIRRSGRIAAQAVELVGEHARPGVTTDELDRIAHEFLVKNGAYPSTLGYRGYPKSICSSLNEVICHGIPDDTVLHEGDILNIDISAFIDGVHGDTNGSVVIGSGSESATQLVERTKEAMHRGIRAALPGREVSIIGRAIESYAKRFGLVHIDFETQQRTVKESARAYAAIIAEHAKSGVGIS